MRQLIVLMFIAVASFSVQAQKFKGLDVSPLDKIQFPSDHGEAKTLLHVLYSRPQLKARELTKLAPHGKIWRTGANEAVEITFNVPMYLGETAIPVGSYSLFTIPGESEWTVIINKATNIWGAYNYSANKDVVRMQVPVVQTDQSLEAFSMAIEAIEEEIHLHIGWDTVRISVPFRK